MKKSTLVFCLEGNKVLLGMKKRGFGEGKWNGYGGKVDGFETPEEAAVRELMEESSVKISTEDLSHVAKLDFYFADKPVFECFVYLVEDCKNKFAGDPIETEEMKPGWFSIDELPFDDMWVDDKYWLPQILAGEKFNAKVTLNEEGTDLVDFSVIKAKDYSL